jgi:transposase
MEAMWKSEVARRAGVSVNTLMAWCKPYKEELERMGLGPRAKKLQPHIVEFLAEKLCIDI